MEFENIIFKVEDKVARILINRPPQNIVDIATLQEMLAAMESLERRKDARVLLLSAEGDKAFSTGVSVQDHLADKVDEMIPLFSRAMRAAYHLDIPIVAAVKGYCLGGGCELAVMCDLVVAAESARIGQPEITLGDYAPIGVATYARILGPKKAFELLLLGETLTATKAKELGLVNIVVPDARFAAEVEAVLQKLASMSLVSLKASKRAIYMGMDMGFNEALTMAEYIYLNLLAKSHDGMEGLKAFLEKRKPVWRDE